MRVMCIYIALCMLATSAVAQQALLKEELVYGGDTLRYRLQYPAGYDSSRSYPVVVFLHGSGARGADNEKQLSNLPAIFTDSAARTAYPCFLLVPQCSSTDAWANFPAFPNSLKATDTPTTAGKMVITLVREWGDRKYIDRKRIYLTGYSMGGEGTLDLVAREPQLFAAAVAVCPVADTATAQRIAGVPVWIFHGDADKVNDVLYSRIMVDALRRADGKVLYTEYPGVGHACWHKAYKEEELLRWMFGQGR